MKITNCICLIILFSMKVCLASGPFKLMAEDLPPFSYLNHQGEVVGITTQIVKYLALSVGHSPEIKLYNWSYAYQKIKNHNGYALYPMNRNPLREDSFKWVGPLFGSKSYLYKRKGSKIKVDSFSDAKKVSKIAMVEGYAGQELLKSKEFNNIFLVSKTQNAIRGLVHRRVDLASIGEILLPFRAQQARIDHNLLERTNLIVMENFQYLAFSKNTPDTVIKQWQKALDTMKTNGVYNTLFESELSSAIHFFEIKNQDHSRQISEYYKTN